MMIKWKTIILIIFVIFSFSHNTFGQSVQWFSLEFESHPWNVLKTKLMFPLVLGKGKAIFLNSFSYLQVFDKYINYGFQGEKRNIEERIYSVQYDFTWIQKLNRKWRLLVGTNTEIASVLKTHITSSNILITALLGANIYTEKGNSFSFGLNYTIGNLFPIPFFQFNCYFTNYIHFYGTIPEYLVFAFVPTKYLDLGLKTEIVTISYGGNPDKYSVKKPFLTYINLWLGVSITVNFFKYLHLGIEGGYSVYRGAALTQKNRLELSDLKNMPILRYSLTVGLK